jgi:hypothetical protein
MFEDTPMWRRAALPGLAVLAVLLGVYLAGGAGQATDDPGARTSPAQAATPAQDR